MRKFINKILNVPKLILRLWIILWVCLVILLVLKFCFGMWFPIVIENEWFLQLNDIFKNNWARYLILCAFYILSDNFLYLISCAKKKYDNWIEFTIIHALLITGFIIKCFFNNFSFIIDIIYSMIIPIIYLLKKYPRRNKAKIILYPILSQVLIMIFQMNILLVRGLDSEAINNEYFILGFVLQLDYYIFLIITWIGVNFMGLWSSWFFGKDITTLKAEKEKELAKEQPDMKKVAEIDEHIKELEKENKKLYL